MYSIIFRISFSHHITIENNIYSVSLSHKHFVPCPHFMGLRVKNPCRPSVRVIYPFGWHRDYVSFPTYAYKCEVVWKFPGSCRNLSIVISRTILCEKIFPGPICHFRRRLSHITSIFIMFLYEIKDKIIRQLLKTKTQFIIPLFVIFRILEYL